MSACKTAFLVVLVGSSLFLASCGDGEVEAAEPAIITVTEVEAGPTVTATETVEVEVPGPTVTETVEVQAAPTSDPNLDLLTLQLAWNSLGALDQSQACQAFTLDADASYEAFMEGYGEPLARSTFDQFFGEKC